MASFSRKVQRQQVKVASSEREMRCDLLEAWIRKHQSVSPPLSMLPWLCAVFSSGFPLPNPHKHWPHLVDTVMALGVMLREMELQDSVDTKLAGSHVLSAMVGAGLWSQDGYPKIRLDDQMASALMLTDSSKAELGTSLPWKAFVVSVPKHTLSYRYEEQTEPTWVEQILVSDSGGVLMLHLIGEEPSLPFSVAWGKTLEGFLEARESWDKHAVVADLAVNLVRGVLLQVQAGHLHQETLPQRERSGHRWRQPGALPETTDYVLGSDVQLKHDYVAAVREIASGTKRYTKVQWMVRGHKRWQACGERWQNRKLIWVVPHWKGRVDAPILRRDHVMKETP